MITRDMIERYCAKVGLDISPSVRFPRDEYRDVREIDLDLWVIARYNTSRVPAIEVWSDGKWTDVFPQSTQDLGKLLQKAIDDLLDRNRKHGISPIRIAMVRELLLQAGSEIVGV